MDKRIPLTCGIISGLFALLFAMTGIGALAVWLNFCASAANILIYYALKAKEDENG